jgi:hypothetical protein
LNGNVGIVKDLTVSGKILNYNMTTIQELSLTYIVPKSGTLLGLTSQGLNMATSSNGQYVSICASGCIQVSKDFGVTFIKNTFPEVVFALAMSSSGGYQVAVTTGVPAAIIYVSYDFGLTWEATPIGATSSYNKWMHTVAVSPNGKYTICAGSNGIANFSSTDYGPPFSNFPSSSETITSAVSDNGIVYTAGSTGIYHGCDLTFALQENLAYTVGTITSPGSMAFSRDSNSLVHVSPSGVSYAGDITFVPTLNTSRTDLEQVCFTNNQFWARTSTSVCTSLDYGSTWTTVYTGTPRTISVSTDNKVLYILLQNGTLLRSYLSIYPAFYPGYCLSNSGVDQILSMTTLIGTTSITLPSGIWSLSGRFRIYSTSSADDAVSNRHVLFGLSTNDTGDESPNLTINNLPFDTIFALPKSWPRFSCNAIVKFEVPTTVYLRVRLNYLTPTTIQKIDNPTIKAFLISN